jgi:hypothetical protein
LRRSAMPLVGFHASRTTLAAGQCLGRDEYVDEYVDFLTRFARSTFWALAT